MAAEFGGQCEECRHCEEEHDCLSENGECLNTRCDCRGYRPRAAASATIASGGGTYASTPIEGRRSPFYTTDGRYYANADDAQRAQTEIDELAALEARLAAAGDAAERLFRHRFALTPAGRALVAAMREQFDVTERGRAALAADARQEGVR